MGKIFHQLLYTQATLHTLYIGPIQTCVYVLINDNIGVNVSLYKNSSIFWLSKSTVCIISCHTCRSRNCWLFMAMLCCISLQQCFFYKCLRYEHFFVLRPVYYSNVLKQGWNRKKGPDCPDPVPQNKIFLIFLFLSQTLTCQSWPF